MKVILDKEKYNAIDKIYRSFLFSPSCKTNNELWLSFPVKSKKYRLNCYFSEEQEKNINFIFVV